MKPRTRFLAAPFLAFAMTQASHAASGNWTGLGADSNWTTTGNWSASPVPGAGDTANFNSAGNGKTTITTAPAALTAYTFSTGAAAYTISAATTWSVPNGGGVTINSGVVNAQDLSGIQFLRPAVDSTVNFDNKGSGTLTLGTIFTQNPGGTNVTQSVLKFTPGASGTIEIASTKLVDNAGTGGAKKISVLLDDAGILKMAGTGTFSGTDADGNSVTIRQGTYMANVIGVIGTPRTSLGSAGRIQLGETGQSRTATLDYYNAANATTDRVFHIIDNNTAVFKVSGGADTNLELTSGITQSGAANGGGKLTKDGVGILTLANTHGYTGATTVTQGKLVVAGNISTSVLTTVEENGTLGGAGTTGTLTVLDGGTLAPGNSAGTLTVSGALTLNNLSNLAFELNPADTTVGLGVNDLVSVTGNLTLDGLLKVTATSGSFASVTSGTWRLFGYSGTLSDNILDLDDMPTLASGYSWSLDTATSGQVNLVVIPEPGAALLGGLGLLCLLRRRRA